MSDPVPFNIFSTHVGKDRPRRPPEPQPVPIDGHRYSDGGCQCGNPLDLTATHWTGHRPPPDHILWAAWWRHIYRHAGPDVWRQARKDAA